MPFYYDVVQTTNLTPLYTTNASGNTESDHILGISATAYAFSLVELNVAIKNSTTVGSGSVLVKTGGTSTAGTNATVQKRHPNNPSANSTWSTTITTAGSPAIRLALGMAQVGGHSVWMAYSPDSAIIALGGGNKMEFFSITATAAQAAYILPVIAE